MNHVYRQIVITDTFKQIKVLLKSKITKILNSEEFNRKVSNEMAKSNKGKIVQFYIDMNKQLFKMK